MSVAVVYPAIPLQHYFVAAKDNKLRALVRRKVKLLHAVEEARAAVRAVEADLAQYVATAYPADGEPSAAAEGAEEGAVAVG